MNVLPQHRDLLPNNRRNPLMLAFLLAAGGTAKTTTTVNLATVLALRGYTVRVFDLDPQCNASETFGRNEAYRDAEEKSIWDIFSGKATLDEATVTARYRIGEGDDDDAFAEIPNLYLVQGSGEMKNVDTTLAHDPQRFFWFAKLIQEYQQGHREAAEREVWLLDLPANYGKLTVTIMTGLTEDDEVIPPLLVTGKEEIALDKLMEELETMRREFVGSIFPGTPVVRRILLCSTPTSSHNASEYHETITNVEANYPGWALPYVRHSGYAAKQYRTQCSPVISRPSSAPAEDYTAVADALGFPDLEPAV